MEWVLSKKLISMGIQAEPVCLLLELLWVISTEAINGPVRPLKSLIMWFELDVKSQWWNNLLALCLWAQLEGQNPLQLLKEAPSWCEVTERHQECGLNFSAIHCRYHPLREPLADGKEAKELGSCLISAGSRIILCHAEWRDVPSIVYSTALPVSQGAFAMVVDTITLELEKWSRKPHYIMALRPTSKR